MGNLSIEKQPTATVKYKYNNLNQLTSMQNWDGTTSYTYDKRGNRIGSRLQNYMYNLCSTYEYDATNMLTKGEDGKGRAFNKSYYTYNALGVRVGNHIDDQLGWVFERDFVIDYTSYERNDLAIYASTKEDPSKLYDGKLYDQKNLYAHGRRLEMWYYQYTDSRVTISPTVEFTFNAHEDIMGSASYYTKQTGAVYEEHIYDAWGGVRWSTGYGVNDGKTLVIEPNYTGHSYDPILKIYHAEARFYDGKTRQWMASDPIKSGLNWYQYVESNPTTYVDPDGLAWEYIGATGPHIVTDETFQDRNQYDVSQLFPEWQVQVKSDGNEKVYLANMRNKYTIEWRTPRQNTVKISEAVAVIRDRNSGAVVGKSYFTVFSCSVAGTVFYANPQDFEKYVRELTGRNSSFKDIGLNFLNINRLVPNINSLDPTNLLYIYDSIEQLMLGSYTDKVTALGIVLQLGSGFAGIDLPADVRELVYDIDKWGVDPSVTGSRLMFDLAMLFPVIGSLGVADEILNALKHSDKIETVLKHADEVVVLAGKGSTGRTAAIDLIEEIAMNGAMRRPFDPGEGNSARRIIDSLNDERWKGWEKWEIVYRTEAGRNVTIHFTYNPLENLFDDFKFK